MAIGFKKAVFGLVASVIVLAIFVMAGFWLLAVWIDRLLGWGPILGTPLSQVLGAASLLIGVFWVTWSYSYLLFVGQGLPLEWFGVALHPTRVLVTTGPYAYVRNPAVIGLLFLGLGVAFLADSLAGVLLVPLIAALAAVYLVLFEEKALAKRFGDDYEEYRRNVPLLIPRLTPYLHATKAAS